MGFAICKLPLAATRMLATAGVVYALVVQSASAVGFYRVEREAAGAWRLTNPEGRPTVWLGVDHVKFNGFRCEAENNRMHYREANIKKFVTRAAHCCAGLKGLSPLRGIV